MKAAAVELAVIACSQKLFLIIAIARFIESLAEKKSEFFHTRIKKILQLSFES